MALARLITRTPEYAQQLAQSLHGAGYTVEFVSPENIPPQPAELEVNLDDPSAASAYIVTADGREISFAYDPVEREFVLAPLWRKITGAIAPLRERFRRPESESDEALPPEVIAESPVAAEPLPVAPVTMQAAVEEPPPAVLPKPLVTESLYLPTADSLGEPAEEALHFSGVDYFDGLGERRTKSVDEPLAAEPGVTAGAPEPEASRTPSTPWLVKAAVQVEVLREQLRGRWNAAQRKASAGSRRLREYDRAWIRAVPTAAVITLAFLLGWGFANSGESAHGPVAASPMSPEVKEAAVVPVAAPKAPVMKATTTRPETKTKSRRVVREADEEDDAPDVVIRHYPKHYPSKSVQAANPKNVKRFSDLED